MLFHNQSQPENWIPGAGVRSVHTVEGSMNRFGPLLRMEPQPKPPLSDKWNGLLLKHVHFRWNGCRREFFPEEFEESIDARLCMGRER